MSKYKKSELVIYGLNKFYEGKAKSLNKSIDEIKLEIRDNILTELYKTENLEERISGMLFRNKIRGYTNIGEDVLQESFYQLLRYNVDDLFLAYCDDKKRIVSLAVNIISKTGFRKMSTDISPNQSEAKKILFASNLNKLNFINTNGNIEFKDQEEKEHELPPIIYDQNLWDIILPELNNDEQDFFYFLLSNVYNRKYKNVYTKELREKYFTYNEYKIKMLMFSNRVQEILIKNKINL